MKYKEEILEAVKDVSSMSQAADKCGLAFSTFKRYAIRYGVYNTNQAGKGTKKPKKSLEDVFSGKIHLVTYQLRIRLIEEKYLENYCSECGIDSWNNKPLSLELDHIDGNRYNNSLSNLRILCPNCHSQTPTFRKKNVNK